MPPTSPSSPASARPPLLFFLLGYFLSSTASSPAPPIRAWHVTDIHLDPTYVVGSDADHSCYCTTHDKSPHMMATTCGMNGTALPWGTPEGNCATPMSLFNAAMAKMAEEDVSMVLSTGDFGNAGLSTPMMIEDARQQITDVIHQAWRGLKASIPKARVFGVLGNHDSAPGDLFDGPEKMGWLYKNLTALWGEDLGHDPAALETLGRGGYYSVSAAPGLRVMGMNVNYWVNQNPALADRNGTAYEEGQRQLAWLGDELAAAQQRGESVWLLGHQPPEPGFWLEGVYAKFLRVTTPHMRSGTIKAHFFGHVHTDDFVITRACEAPPPPKPGPKPPQQWRKTTGIKWCSGGGDFASGDAFGAGVDGLCPLLPEALGRDAKVDLCKKVCAAPNASSCVGFTWYPDKNGGQGECCFRTGSTASKPADPTSDAECYEKDAGPRCAGNLEALGVVLASPSLTEGFPAANPALRLVEFEAPPPPQKQQAQKQQAQKQQPGVVVELPHDNKSTGGSSTSGNAYGLLDIKTYVADISAANKAGAGKGNLDFQLEYSHKDLFGMKDLSATSFEDLVRRMACDNSTEWAAYRGRGANALYWKSWAGPTAAACEGSCKSKWLVALNGTAELV